MNDSKRCADSPDSDVDVDVTTGDPVYEPIQFQPYESTASCIAAESTEKLIENPTCDACPLATGESDSDRVENIYSTIPGQ